MEVIYKRCCGLDVHKDTVVACLMIREGGKVHKEVRTFLTMTVDLVVLHDWLKAHEVTHVAMESTGIYWRPVFNLLEEDFTVLLVNAAHIKTVPGRKTDVKDCEWIADLLSHGLLRGSFIPPEPIQFEPEAPPKKRVRPWLLLSLVFTVILSTAFFFLYPARQPEEKRSSVASLSLIPPSLVVESEANARPIYQAQQSQSSEPEREETKVFKEETPALRVLEAGIGTGIEKDGIQQFLVGKCSSIRSNNQRGYFFTRIKTPREGKIAHIWLWEARSTTEWKSMSSLQPGRFTVTSLSGRSG
jgi:hypothetical protein